MDVTPLVCKAMGLDIRHLPADVLMLIFSLLHGQDIARCNMVCRCFSALIRSDLYLQYMIELAQIGMIDGQSSSLPISERLQCLREYASRFRNGNFDHEDLTAHGEYASSFLNDPIWTFLEMSSHENSLSTLYTRGPHDSPLRKPHRFVLSVFTPGSAQAGIQSSRCLLPIDGPDPEGEPRPRWISRWAIDGGQDLLVMAEGSNVDTPEQLQHWMDEFRICFYSFSASKTAGPTPHPAGMLPAVRIFDGPVRMQNDVRVLPSAQIVDLHISGQYVIWVLDVTRGGRRTMSIEVCDWRRGEVISRTDVGTEPVQIVPLDYPYFLVVPKLPHTYPHHHIEAYPPALDIYNLSPSVTPSPHVCTLQLHSENLAPGESMIFNAICTGDRPQTSDGHFLPDLSRSIVVLTFYIHGPHGERETHLLIPRATLLAQLRAAESAHQTGGSETQAVRIPWADWGPQGCLRLSLPSPVSGHRAVPFGSRFPLFVLDESDPRHAAVCVFDVDPLVARSQRQVSSISPPEEPAAGTTTIIIEDIEAVLPGVVDPDCSSIPYVAYRFQLPHAPKEWRFIEAVVMGMTGFTIKVLRFYLQQEQTWTV
ncbi:hypothetical protein V8D89_005052 [Ganoderma adspersum]